MFRTWCLILISSVLLLITYQGYAQQKNESKRWYNPSKEDFLTVHNQHWSGSEIENPYDRLPVKAKDLVRKEVWNLSRNAAGLKVVFRTDAEKVVVRYVTTSKNNYAMPHFPATGVSGIDLFAENTDKTWSWANGSYQFSDTITYTFLKLDLEKEKYSNGRLFHLFLPLYNTISWLEIGVPEEQSFEFIPASNEKPIVVYGTSIAQGGCASRAGMAWTNILNRSLHIPVVNFGFSGNGRLEKELIDLLVEKEARVFVLDCLPNLGGEVKNINAKLLYAVNRIRSTYSKTPILLVDHSAYLNGRMNSSVSTGISKQNEILENTYKELLSSGVKNVFYLKSQDIGLNMNDFVDGTHPTDSGMLKYAIAYEKAIKNVLDKTESK